MKRHGLLIVDDEKEILAAVLYYAFDGTLQEASPQALDCKNCSSEPPALYWTE